MLALVLKVSRNVEAHPSALLTLLCGCRCNRVRITSIADSIIVAVSLIRVGDELAIVRAVSNGIVIVVGVARIARCVAIIVGLIGVSDELTIIGRVGHTIIIVVRVADITLRITIVVRLVGIGIVGQLSSP